MVMNDDGQLYTIEGITAGIIMLLTAYVVFSTGFVFTPGDAHIADMQLQQLGYDALLVMDTPVNTTSGSMLQELIMNNDQTGFKNEFNALIQKGTGATHMKYPSPWFIIDERTQWNATINFRDIDHDNLLHSYSFGNSANGDDFVTREPAISVTRYVYLEGRPNPIPPEGSLMDNRKQMVLLEVLLWRG